MPTSLPAPSRRAVLALPLLAALGPARAAAASVRIENFVFSPALLVVAPGSVVTWTNADDIPHVVAAEDGSFHSPALDTDERFAARFERPGQVRYFCALHPHMVGVIEIRASAEASP
ncbi:blue (type 1) copper domain protein [Methylobacterium sp. 4-46]|uniref:cupredoxin domain-containing protein n=1 Tax=unclassified Methylobacterium TaxID=2615210 RepID=UPI000152C976|nr:MULTISPECIES: cupredoxin family copper-binding protein [Methylobacterium]ACA19120.1 blue (type 1) copper domain protein [Methylobacterium sp. 4-46]WFT78331.1 cupredoxin family copper-binding protein [Methylobacterium nodulans]